MKAMKWFYGAAACVVVAFLVLQSGCQKASPPAKPKAKEQASKPEDKSKEEPAAAKQKADEKADVKPTEPRPHEPAAKAPDKPAETPADKPTEKPADKVAAKPAAFPVPRGLPPLPIPADNPMTPEKIELGKMLYFDKRVSKDGSVSCATCHDPKMAWAEKTPTSTGIGKQVGGRNSPTVMNAAYATSMFWDGRAATLEEQATGPVENPIEMGHSMANLVAQLDKIPAYRERFQKVFGTGVTEEGFAKAVAAFERTVLAGDSPYDRFKDGDASALTDAQKRGLELFNKVGCADCHSGFLFSDYEFHNAGVGMDKEKPDAGRKDVTKNDEDMGAFRVPSLRNVADTAPYFHDGSAKSLEEAVALMAAGGKDNKHRSPDFDAVREAKVTPEQQKDLVEFLKALSGPIPAVEPPALP